MIDLKKGRGGINAEIKKAEAFLKPFFIYLIYMYSNSWTKMNGTLNPTLALQSMLWMYLTFHNQFDTLEPDKSLWDQDHYGRYYWVYIFAPLLASLAAAFLAKKHIQKGEAALPKPRKLKRELTMSEAARNSGQPYYEEMYAHDM
jgi:hypothetical protein